MKRRARISLPAVALAAVLSAPVLAQVPAPDNRNPNFFSNLNRDLVQERVNLGSCKSGLKGVPGCAETVFTGTPFHLAVGSLPPQNGVGVGLAFGEVYHPTYCASWMDFTGAPTAGHRNACHWSVNLNAVAQASSNQSWRAGFYATFVRLSSRRPVMHFPGQPRPRHAVPDFTGPSTTVGLYSEATSLNRIYFYGLGPNTTPGGRADFGLSENITGTNLILAVKPAWLAPLGMAFVGEINGRFLSLRGSYGDTSPSIETLYNEASAPGLTTAPNYFQAGEGVRLVPALPLEQLHLNYLVNFQEFVASTARYSFRRFTADLDHQLVLYTKDVGKPRPARPPLPGAPDVPPISPTRDLTSSLSARLLIVESVADAGRVVPFYLQPTIGGSDLNGQSVLASYPDYRFRAPNLMLIHGAYEQSLGKVPIGLFVAVDEAKVGLRRNDIGFSHMRHSYSAGLTVHAGGLPVLYLLFAWGGPEGHHTIANISSELLGVSTQPSLY